MHEYRSWTLDFDADHEFTRDAVPVNVRAVLDWRVADLDRVSRTVIRCEEAIDCVARRCLSELVGFSTVAQLLLDHHRGASRQLRDAIGRETFEWGVAIGSVEILDVTIPKALQAQNDDRLLRALRRCLLRHRTLAIEDRSR